MTAPTIDVVKLYKARAGTVELVDVPEMGYLAVDGAGAPESGGFAEAIQALYAVAYGVHFQLKKRDGAAPRVMPLEALWWTDDPHQQDILVALASGAELPAQSDQSLWRWQALLMQPELIGPQDVAEAQAAAGRKLPDNRALARLRYLRWEEGRAAQVLHVGPYDAEAPTIVRLHDAIAAAGYQPRGNHHEIYLGDPRRSAPERLRTILRHPVQPA